jgi:cellulose synthase/poly-beta-1,6-N-acetylglucosamine synthase-like glycosyltransferase
MVSRRAIGGALWVFALTVVAAFGHVAYPAVLLIRTRRLGDPVPPDPGAWPALSVVVPAFRESAVIASKLATVTDNGYPGELEVIVVADDHATAAAARQTSARVLERDERTGKSDAVNLGVSAAAGAIVVLTDANNPLLPGALAAAARWFADPSVGAVAGEKRVEGGEALFWRFESWLKRRESRTGTTIGLVGELAAFRRELFRPLPSDTAVDDLWLALDLLERRARIVYEPAAATVEQEEPGLASDWERRTRIVAGVFDLLRRRWRLLVPGRMDGTLQLWGHRAIRLSLGPVAHLLLLGRAIRRAPGSIAWSLVVAGHLLALAALARRLRGRPSGGVTGAAASVLFLQAVALGGMLRFARRDRVAVWPKPERARPTATEPDRLR